MPTPSNYFAAALPWARLASTLTGVAVPVILAQWDEEGQGWPPAYNNPGDVGDPTAAGQTGYATVGAGVQAYANTMLQPDYRAVRAAQGWQAQAYALGASPWAASHYGSPPGQALVDIIETNDLLKYDDAPPAPAPAPVESLSEVQIMGFAK
jgi:hypothetical protein